MGAYINGVACDLYVGKGAGRKLLGDIDSASESIKICSPFLSPALIRSLIKLGDKALEIELITPVDIESFGVGHDLIKQHQTVDKKAAVLRDKWIKAEKILWRTALALFALFPLWLIALGIFNTITIGLGIGPVAAFFLASRMFRSKASKQRIYHYSYDRRFPFRIYRSPDYATFFL